MWLCCGCGCLATRCLALWHGCQPPLSASPLPPVPPPLLARSILMLETVRPRRGRRCDLLPICRLPLLWLLPRAAPGPLPPPGAAHVLLASPHFNSTREQVNYVEHYGLSRRKGEDGR